MIETKIMEVDESYYQRVINEMQCFGWVVKSTQKIDYTTTYTTGGGNRETGYEFTVHNKRLAYYCISFQRDTKMDNFKELDELYKDYLRLLKKYGEITSSKIKKSGLFVFLIILDFIISASLMTLGMLFVVRGSEFARTGFCFFIPGFIVFFLIGLFVYFEIKERDKCKELRKQLEWQMNQARKDIEDVIKTAKEIAYK